MAGTGSYSGGSASANYVPTIQGLLSELPDNNAQLINAQNVRDSIWTLWNRIDDVGITASYLGSQSIYYTNLTPTPITFGGLTAGSTFTSYSVSQVFDELFYPWIAPTSSLVISPNIRQFGQSTIVNLYYSVSPATDPISGISVDGETVIPIGGYQSGFVTHNTAFYPGTPGLTFGNTFTMSIAYGSPTHTQYSYANLTWMHRMYWGRVDLSGSPSFNPDLTLHNTPLVRSQINSIITDPVIRALNGAGAGSGNNLVQSINTQYLDMRGQGQYLVWAFPTPFAANGTPYFMVNGVVNTAFTKVRTAPFVNEYGFTFSYDVWISNTRQYVPLDIDLVPFGEVPFVDINYTSVSLFSTGTPSEVLYYNTSGNLDGNLNFIYDPSSIFSVGTSFSNINTSLISGTFSGIPASGGNTIDNITNEKVSFLASFDGTDYTSRLKYKQGSTQSVLLVSKYGAFWQINSQAFSLPHIDGNPGDVMTTDGSGNITFQAGGSGGVVGGYVQNLIGTTQSVIVPPGYEYFVYGDLNINGNLENSGKVIIANGNMIMGTSGTYSNIGTLQFVNLLTTSDITGTPSQVLYYGSSGVTSDPGFYRTGTNSAISVNFQYGTTQSGVMLLELCASDVNTFGITGIGLVYNDPNGLTGLISGIMGQFGGSIGTYLTTQVNNTQFSRGVTDIFIIDVGNGVDTLYQAIATTQSYTAQVISQTNSSGNKLYLDFEYFSQTNLGTGLQLFNGIQSYSIGTYSTTQSFVGSSWTSSSSYYNSGIGVASGVTYSGISFTDLNTGQLSYISVSEGSVDMAVHLGIGETSGISISNNTGIVHVQSYTTSHGNTFLQVENINNPIFGILSDGEVQMLQGPDAPLGSGTFDGVTGIIDISNQLVATYSYVVLMPRTTFAYYTVLGTGTFSIISDQPGTDTSTIQYMIINPINI